MLDLTKLNLGLAANTWTSASRSTAIILRLHVESNDKTTINFRCPVTKINWHMQTKLGIKTEVSN